MFTKKLHKLAYMFARLDQIGFGDQAEELATNPGIQMFAAGMTAKELAPKLKKALEKELCKKEKGSKSKGFIKRVDPDDLSAEEKKAIGKPLRYTDHMRKGPMSELDFMKESVPTVHYQ